MPKRKGKSLKKNHAVDVEEAPEVVNAPHSFVIHRGLPFQNLIDLTKDFRQMMEPFTASHLRERRNNKIKDFVSLSGVFHVSHMCIFNKSANQLSFKVARLPKGPTLSFKVHQFTLARDVLASMKKQYYNNMSFKHSPLVILNNFTGEGNHLKVMANTFQNMFPSINLATVNLSTIKRCVLFSYNPTTQLIDMRHYAVVVVPVGLNRSVKKVVMGKVPNLSKCEDIADFVEQSAVLSESEYEDDETNEVVLPQTLKSRGNLENNKSAIRLYEIGPRMTMELIKVQDDLFKGETLYHSAIVKTEEELAQIKKERAQKKKLKELRKKIQNENIEKKLKSKEENKQKSLFGIQMKKEAGEGDVDDEERQEDTRDDEQNVDNDAAYFREEVGVEPDEDLFQTSDSNSRKRPFVPKHMKHKNNDAKRRKTDVNESKGGQKIKKGGSKFKKESFDSDKKFNGKKKKFESPPKNDKKTSKKVKPKPKKKGKKKAHRNKNK